MLLLAIRTVSFFEAVTLYLQATITYIMFFNEAKQKAHFSEFKKLVWRNNTLNLNQQNRHRKIKSYLHHFETLLVWFLSQTTINTNLSWNESWCYWGYWSDLMSLADIKTREKWLWEDLLQLPYSVWSVPADITVAVKSPLKETQI